MTGTRGGDQRCVPVNRPDTSPEGCVVAQRPAVAQDSMLRYRFATSGTGRGGRAFATARAERRGNSPYWKRPSPLAGVSRPSNKAATAPEGFGGRPVPLTAHAALVCGRPASTSTAASVRTTVRLWSTVFLDDVQHDVAIHGHPGGRPPRVGVWLAADASAVAVLGRPRRVTATPVRGADPPGRRRSCRHRQLRQKTVADVEQVLSRELAVRSMRSNTSWWFLAAGCASRDLFVGQVCEEPSPRREPPYGRPENALGWKVS